MEKQTNKAQAIEQVTKLTHECELIAPGRYTLNELRKAAGAMTDTDKRAELCELLEDVRRYDIIDGQKTVFLKDAEEMNEPDGIISFELSALTQGTAKAIGKGSELVNTLHYMYVRPDGVCVASEGHVLTTTKTAVFSNFGEVENYLLPERIARKYKAGRVTIQRKANDLRGWVYNERGERLDAFELNEVGTFPKWQKAFPNEYATTPVTLSAEQMKALKIFCKAHIGKGEQFDAIIFTLNDDGLTCKGEKSGLSVNFANATPLNLQFALNPRGIMMLPDGAISFRYCGFERALIYDAGSFFGLIMPVISDTVNEPTQPAMQKTEFPEWINKENQAERLAENPVSPQGTPKNEESQKQDEMAEMEQRAERLVAELRELAGKGVRINGITFSETANEAAQETEEPQAGQEADEGEKAPQNEEKRFSQQGAPKFVQVNFQNGNSVVATVEQIDGERVCVSLKGGAKFVQAIETADFSETDERKRTLPEWLRAGTVVTNGTNRQTIEKVGATKVYFEGGAYQHKYALLQKYTPYTEAEQPKKQGIFRRFISRIAAL